MEYYPYPPRSSPSSLSSRRDRVKEVCNFALSAVIGNVFSAIFTFFFAFVGTLLGAMRGALIGQETECRFVRGAFARGAAVGAISGAVFSIEAFESFLILWQSGEESGIGCILFLIDQIASLLSGRLVRERIGPAMLSTVQSQAS